MPKRQGSQPDRSGVKPGEDNLRRNVAAIVAGEQEVMDARSPAEKFSDQIAKHAGRAWSIVAHIVWFGGWIVLNSRLMPEAWRFDPFPYQFLTLVVSLEAIFLSLFILMSQNRATRQADQRSHLDLQINLLAEQESTKILQMLQSLCAFHQLPIADDPDVENLKAATDPAKLLQELKAGMP